MKLTHASPLPTASRPAAPRVTGWRRGSASAVAGIALAAMALIMPISYFGGILPLVDAGDAQRTATAIAAAPVPYLAGVAGIFVVIILDLLVAAAWYVVFAPVDRRVSVIAAWLRVGYTVLFAVAALQLVNASVQLDAPERALAAIIAFDRMWIASLGIFGLHLLVVAWLVVRAEFIASVFGVLLMIAGVGYIADAIGELLDLDLPVSLGTFAFAGEVAIIFWLLIRGRRLRG